MGALSRSELLKGVRLGVYQLDTLIGHGATASVFEGKHVGLGRPVAVKVLHEHLAANPEMRARFLREARVAAKLEHPNVVSVIDVGVEGDIAYLVMERLVGQDAAVYLRAKHRLGVDAALSVVLPITAALAFAHDRGVVHRDLKPSNVFLATDRHNELVPKIVDFGLSKLLTTTVEAAPLTAQDSVIGTLQYMAPEQTYGTKYADEKADQYALAAILYEAVVGHAPFVDEQFYGLLDKVRNAPLVPPSAIVAGLPPAFDQAVTRALARDPAARFEDVRAFARALLPLADARTRTTWERDFAPSAVTAPPASAPLSVRTPPPPSAPQATTLTSAVRATGKIPCDPGLSPFHVKGIAYRGIARLIEKRVPGGMAALERELDDARVAQFISQPFLAASRYDLLPMTPIIVGIARLLGESLEGLAAHLGAREAAHDIEKIYGRLFAAMTFDNLPLFLARFDAQYYDFGDCAGELVAPGHVVLRRAGLPEYVVRWIGPMYSAYIAEILEKKGAGYVEVTPRPPRDAGMRGSFAIVDLEFDVRWRT
jgi:serine/threonine protein kinase